MVAATKLKVTMRTPRMACTRPRTSRTCSQVRWRRRWVRLRELRPVSERLESVGEGMAAAGGGSGPAPEPRDSRRHRARTAGSRSSRSAGTGRAPPFGLPEDADGGSSLPRAGGGSGSAHGHAEPGPPEAPRRTEPASPTLRTQPGAGLEPPAADGARPRDRRLLPGRRWSAGPPPGDHPAPRGPRAAARDAAPGAAPAGGSRGPGRSILRGRRAQGRVPLPGRYR